jgi:hypothetical protein
MITEFTIDSPRADETAIIICNGPSLRGVDLRTLPRVATFGMNVAYRDWDRTGWHPTHYSCLDEVVGMHHAAAVGGLIERRGRGAPSTFLLRRNVIDHLGALALRPDVSNYDDLVETLPPLARQPVTTGSHTLIWAMTLGFRRIFLLGADSNYVEVVAGAAFLRENVLEIVREAENPNYYFEDYQRPGDRYNLPNIGGDTHLKSWRVAAAIAAEMDAHVYNLSPTTRSDAFDFAQVADVLAGGRIRVRPREMLRLRRLPRPAQSVRAS